MQQSGKKENWKESLDDTKTIRNKLVYNKFKLFI